MLVEVEGLREKTHGDLSMLQKMDPQQLSKFLENEHPQTVALVLAHLDAKRGSTLLMLLEPERRVETVRRLAEMRQFSPEMAEKVGVILHRADGCDGFDGTQVVCGIQVGGGYVEPAGHGIEQDDSGRAGEGTAEAGDRDSQPDVYV